MQSKLQQNNQNKTGENKTYLFTTYSKKRLIDEIISSGNSKKKNRSDY